MSYKKKNGMRHTVSWGARLTNDATRYIDCSDATLPYYANLVADVHDRTERAMAQSHCFKVMEIALEAEARATRLGNLAGAM